MTILNETEIIYGDPLFPMSINGQNLASLSLESCDERPIGSHKNSPFVRRPATSLPTPGHGSKRDGQDMLLGFCIYIIRFPRNWYLHSSKY